MALNYPDIVQHNNPNLAVVDSDFVRGGGRIVADLTALYALSSKVDQLKEKVTKVYVTAELAYYILVDISNVGISAGWQIESTGGGVLLSDWVFGEVPSGTIDGTNRVFTLANTPVVGSTKVDVGISQSEGNDYTMSGSTLTFVVGNAPEVGDNITVTYIKL